MTDEEFPRQEFLKWNKVKKVVDAAQIEAVIRAEEEELSRKHKSDIAAGIAQPVTQTARPKQKGIQIKEKFMEEQSLPRKQVYSDAELRDKGKSKIDEHLEKGMLYPLSPMPEVPQGGIQLNRRSTSDTTQVDRTTEKKSISNNAQVYKGDVGKAKSDEDEIMKNFKPVPLSDELRSNSQSQLFITRKRLQRKT